MRTATGSSLRIATAMAAVATCISMQSAPATTIIDEWSTITAPPPPAVKPVTLDSKTTALLMLDFNEQTCNMQRRPRCVASIPRVKTLLTAARSAGVPVFYSLGGGGKPPDIASDLTPAANEPIVSSGVDKFANTD